MQRRIDEIAAIPCITLTVKHEEGSIRVWTFANCKVGDLHKEKGKFNQTGCHSILQHKMIPFGMQLVGQGFVLMQDNYPKHAS